jgi:hypothetical protein
MAGFGDDIPKGLMSTVKDVLKQNQDLYGDDLRSRYSTPEAPSPEPEAPAPEAPVADADPAPEAPAPDENNEE